MIEFIKGISISCLRIRLDVIIRNVPPKAYREFKARATKLGLRIGEALKEAMEAWASTEGEAGVLQDRNDDAFRRMRPTLGRKYDGKYIAISNGQLIAVADTMERLAAALRRRKIARCRTVHLGVDELGEGGEWLWSAIGQEIASSRKSSDGILIKPIIPIEDLAGIDAGKVTLDGMRKKLDDSRSRDRY